MGRFSTKVAIVSLGGVSLFSAQASIEQYLDPATHYEQVLSTALVLTESDLVSVGFNNFDPNKIFGTDNENLGGAEAINTARQVATGSLPTTFFIGETDEEWLQRIKLRFAWVMLEREFDYQALGVSNWAIDEHREHIYSGYAEYSLGYRLTPKWTLYAGTGVHLMHYRNSFEENSPFLREINKATYRNYFNTTTNAWVVEPQFDAIYTQQYPLSDLQFKSEYHYFYGENFGGSGGEHYANPKGWRISNSIQIKHHLPQRIFQRPQDLLLRVRRIDLGGDLREPVGASYYNEYSVGWIIDTSHISKLLYNVGIGININYGSALKGGSIVLFYNE